MAKLDDREIYEMNAGQLDDYLQSCSGLGPQSKAFMTDLVMGIDDGVYDEAVD